MLASAPTNENPLLRSTKIGKYSSTYSGEQRQNTLLCLLNFSNSFPNAQQKQSNEIQKVIAKQLSRKCDIFEMRISNFLLFKSIQLMAFVTQSINLSMNSVRNTDVPTKTIKMRSGVISRHQRWIHYEIKKIIFRVVSELALLLYSRKLNQFSHTLSERRSPWRQS